MNHLQFTPSDPSKDSHSINQPLRIVKHEGPITERLFLQLITQIKIANYGLFGNSNVVRAAHENTQLHGKIAILTQKLQIANTRNNQFKAIIEVYKKIIQGPAKNTPPLPPEAMPLIDMENSIIYPQFTPSAPSIDHPPCILAYKGPITQRLRLQLFSQIKSANCGLFENSDAFKTAHETTQLHSKIDKLTKELQIANSRNRQFEDMIEAYKEIMQRLEKNIEDPLHPEAMPLINEEEDPIEGNPVYEFPNELLSGSSSDSVVAMPRNILPGPYNTNI
jgi:hypothetical protein